MARDAADASAAVTGLAIIERPVDGIPMPEGDYSEAASAALATDRLRFSQIAPTHFVDKKFFQSLLSAHQAAHRLGE